MPKKSVWYFSQKWKGHALDHLSISLHKIMFQTSTQCHVLKLMVWAESRNKHSVPIKQQWATELFWSSLLHCDGAEVVPAEKTSMKSWGEVLGEWVRRDNSEAERWQHVRERGECRLFRCQRRSACLHTACVRALCFTVGMPPTCHAPQRIAVFWLHAW